MLNPYLFACELTVSNSEVRAPSELSLSFFLSLVSLGSEQLLGHNRCLQSVYRKIGETLTSGSGNEDGEEMAFKVEMHPPFPDPLCT